MNGRTVLGTALALLGVGLLLEQMELVDVGSILSTWWPLVLVAVGSLKLWSGARLGGAAFLLAGLLFQVHELQLLPGGFFDYFWPVVLVAAGAWLIASRGDREPKLSSEDRIQNFVLLGGLETRNESQRFEGGSVTVMLGGLDLDLRGARIVGDRASIEVTAVFGGAEIRVPRAWRVTVSGTPLLGGWENKTEHRAEEGEPSPTLELSGIALFGGVEIGN